MISHFSFPPLCRSGTQELFQGYTRGLSPTSDLANWIARLLQLVYTRLASHRDVTHNHACTEPCERSPERCLADVPVHERADRATSALGPAAARGCSLSLSHSRIRRQCSCAARLRHLLPFLHLPDLSCICQRHNWHAHAVRVLHAMLVAALRATPRNTTERATYAH